MKCQGILSPFSFIWCIFVVDKCNVAKPLFLLLGGITLYFSVIKQGYTQRFFFYTDSIGFTIHRGQWQKARKILSYLKIGNVFCCRYGQNFPSLSLSAAPPQHATADDGQPETAFWEYLNSIWWRLSGINRWDKTLGGIWLDHWNVGHIITNMEDYCDRG